MQLTGQLKGASVAKLPSAPGNSPGANWNFAAPSSHLLDPKQGGFAAPTLSQPSSFDYKFNEEIITPYILVNKTGMNLVIKRLIEKEKALHLQSKAAARSHQLLARHQSQYLYQGQQFRKNLINVYRLKQGQIIDYMVDYSQDKLLPESGGGSTSAGVPSQQVLDPDDLQSLHNNACSPNSAAGCDKVPGGSAAADGD